MTVFITGLATTSTRSGNQRREADGTCGFKHLETNPETGKRTIGITPPQRQSLSGKISLESAKSEIATPPPLRGADAEGALPIKNWIAPSVELHQILNCFTLTDNFRLAWINSPPSPIPIIDGMRYDMQRVEGHQTN